MEIKVSQLTKSYGATTVLKSLEFTIEGPSIVGFLGHNGAGKTSFLNMLAGLIAPSQGSIKVDGVDVFDNAKMMKQMCFIAETGNFANDLSVSDIFKINARFYPNWNEELANKLLAQFSLNKKMIIRKMSKGMVSALGIITGIACEAPITIFDEPYIGLDAAGRYLFYELLIEQYSITPRTFILSTHLIDEVSDLFEEVIILHEGELILQRKAEQLQETVLQVRGKLEDIDQFSKQGYVLHRSAFMNEHSAVIMLDEPIATTDQMLKVRTVKLQELMVLLSKNQREAIDA